MQTCRESQRDGGLVYVCVGGGVVKGSSEARNGICYWDYRTTNGYSQMIATLKCLSIGHLKPSIFHLFVYECHFLQGVSNLPRLTAGEFTSTHGLDWCHQFTSTHGR